MTNDPWQVLNWACEYNKDAFPGNNGPFHSQHLCRERPRQNIKRTPAKKCRQYSE